MAKDSEFAANQIEKPEEHVYIMQPSMQFDSKKGTSASSPFLRMQKVDPKGENMIGMYVSVFLNIKSYLMYLIGIVDLYCC